MNERNPVGDSPAGFCFGCRDQPSPGPEGPPSPNAGKGYVDRYGLPSPGAGEGLGVRAVVGCNSGKSDFPCPNPPPPVMLSGPCRETSGERSGMTSVDQSIIAP